jgi:hypothetical protein
MENERQENQMNAETLLAQISEPITEIPAERIVACPVCDGDRDFDDPVGCPECAGTRTVVL